MAGCVSLNGSTGSDMNSNLVEWLFTTIYNGT